MTLKELPEKPNAPFNEETLVTSFKYTTRIAEDFCEWLSSQLKSDRQFQKSKLVIYHDETKSSGGKTIKSRNAPIGVLAGRNELFFDPKELFRLFGKRPELRKYPEVAVAVLVFHDFVHLLQSQNLLPIPLNNKSVLEDQADYFTGVIMHWMQDTYPRLKKGELEGARSTMRAMGSDTPFSILAKLIFCFIPAERRYHADEMRQKHGYGTAAIREGWFLKGLAVDFSKGTDHILEPFSSAENYKKALAQIETQGTKHHSGVS